MLASGPCSYAGHIVGLLNELIPGRSPEEGIHSHGDLVQMHPQTEKHPTKGGFTKRYFPLQRAMHLNPDIFIF